MCTYVHVRFVIGFSPYHLYVPLFEVLVALAAMNAQPPYCFNKAQEQEVFTNLPRCSCAVRKNFRDGDRFFTGTSLITLLLFMLLLFVGSGTRESMDGGAIGSLVLVVLSTNSAFLSSL